ncbi:MAG: hypothetical protein IKC59_03085 [Clostridia bacterium]|nr:hypothetical protein [Clostridia bacterium]
MKKFLSVFITLAMTLALFAFPTSADTAGSVSQSGELYDTTQAVNGVLTLDGVEYTVINEANKDLFMNMSGEGKYILGADLDFSDTEGNPTAWGAADAWYGTLEGNGHTVTGFSVDQGGMFDWSGKIGEGETGEVKITNVTFGSSDALISVSHGSNYYQGLFSQKAYYRTYWIENVEAYVTVGSGKTNNYYMGGLIGELGKTGMPVVATFKDCVVDGNINGTIFLGGYVGLIGYNAGTKNVINFVNCINSVDITAQPEYRIRAGFIGAMNGSCGTVNVTNCINEGNIIGGCYYTNGKYYCSRPAISALVGVNDSGGKLNVKGFLNLGEIKLTAGDHTDNDGNAVAADEHIGSTGVVLGYQGTKQGVTSASNVVTTVEAMNTLGNPILVTADDLASGKASYLLGKGFGQKIGVETMPTIGGMPVAERVNGDEIYYENVTDAEDPDIDDEQPEVDVVEPGSGSQNGEIYDTTKAVNGVLTLADGAYIVINEANKDTFMNMSGDNKYILGADLDFIDHEGSPTKWGDGIEWYGILEGNGHKVTGFSVNRGGMFVWGSALEVKASISVRNITFGTSRNPISVTYDTTNYDDTMGLLARSVGEGSNVGNGTKKLSVTNMTAYIDNSGEGNRKNIGGLIGHLRDSSTATFTNCEVIGSVYGSSYYVGGYIGCCEKGGTVEFIGCKFDGNVSSASHTVGGYIGRYYQSGALAFTDCEFAGDVMGAMVVSGYIGKVDSCGPVTFDKCSVDATVIGVGDGDRLAGFLSEYVSTNALSFKNCAADVTISGKYNLGGYVGKTGNSATFTGCLAVGSVEGDANSTKGFVAGFVGNGNADVTFAPNCVNGMVTQGVLVTTHTEPTAVTAEELASGKCAYQLGEAFGQVIGVDKIPVLGGWAVIERVDGNNIYYENVYTPIQSVDDLKQISGNGRYRLENDLVLTEPVEISGGKDGNSIILDLGGKTLTGNIVVADGTIVIRNGKLISVTDAAAITVDGNSVLRTLQLNVSGKLGVEISGSATVTLGAKTVVDASDVAVFGNGANEESVLTVDGAELKVTGDASSDSALKWNSLGTLNVSDGTIHADGEGSSLEFIKGNVVISGGIWSGKYAIVLAGAENSTLKLTAGTLQGTVAAVLDKGNSATVVISGGTFSGIGDGAFAADGTFGPSVSVVGGTFDEEIPTTYLHGYVSVKNEDGSYSVKYHDHDYDQYESINIGAHNKICAICKEVVSEAHAWGAYVDDGDGCHYQACIGCGQEGTHREHTEQIDEATGNTVCEICGSVIVLASDTQAPTSADSTDTPDPNDSEEEKGCKSTVSYAVILVVMIVACGLIVREEKKKEFAKL